MTDLLSRLSLRERWFVLGAALFFGSVLIFSLVVNPLLDQKRRYTRMVRDKQEELARFNQFTAQYRYLKATLADLEKKMASGSSDMSLLAVMESSARKLGLADRIASMKPFTTDLDSGMVQSSVEMRIEKVDLRGLVQLLETVETGPDMAVTTRLRIKTRFDDPSLLDTTLLVSKLEAR